MATGKRKRLIFTAMAVALVGIVAGLLLRGTSTPTPPPTLQQAANEVAILGRAFIPRIITVTAGTTVTWTNLEEAESHVPTSDDGLFGAELVLNESYSYTFTEPGIYTYYCTIHYGDMFDAKVIVE